MGCWTILAVLAPPVRRVSMGIPITNVEPSVGRKCTKLLVRNRFASDSINHVPTVLPHPHNEVSVANSAITHRTLVPHYIKAPVVSSLKVAALLLATRSYVCGQRTARTISVGGEWMATSTANLRRGSVHPEIQRRNLTLTIL